jgi:hypothetical protein
VNLREAAFGELATFHGDTKSWYPSFRLYLVPSTKLR